jgi:hypothetical protein
VAAIVFSEYILVGSKCSVGPCGIVETMTNETNSRISSTQPSASDIDMTSATLMLAEGRIAVPKRSAELKNVRLDKCHSDSECSSMVS